MSTDFCNLHTHTTYSIMESLIKPSELFKITKELGQSSVAICDRGTLSGAWDCFKYSKEAGVKLLMGCEFYFVDDLETAKNVRLRHIILIAKNHQGYKNLLMLNKLANDHAIIMFKKVIPRIDWKLLKQYSGDLICTTACASGVLGQLISTKRVDEAKIQAKRLKEIFGDNLALEIEPNALQRKANAYNDYSDQSAINRHLIKFGEELDIKIVPATNAHFVKREDQEIHDVMLAIGSGQPKRSGSRLSYNEDFYIKSRQEVHDFFARLYKDKAEQWCDNTLYFADKCEEPVWIDPKYSRSLGDDYELPLFPVNQQPDYSEFQIWKTSRDVVKDKPDDLAYVRFLCEKALKEQHLENAEYIDRLNKELHVFEIRNLSSYMLITYDFIKWAKNNNIPIGHGRGSCSSSLAVFLLNISTADPIKYGLIFERFYNLEKLAMSDIDVDIATSGRERVQNYLRQKYGEDCVAHVSNVNTMTPKVYARDIARAFEFGGDRKAAVAVGTILADAISDEIASVPEALEKAPLFAAFANDTEFAKAKYPQLKKFARLGGLAKAWSTHAGGVVISRRPLHEFIPLRKDKDGATAVEYEKERVESNGLVKMDTLGLSTLDIIENIYDLIKRNGKTPPPTVLNYDDNDAETYDLISRGDTFGVFQFGESSGTVSLCKQLQPKCMDDLAAITALTRPGVPKEFRDRFIKAKFSGMQTELLHPCLKRSLEPTYGIPIFDECMLTLGADVAGWDLNQSDRLRKFIKDKGKHPEKDEKLKKDFIASTIENGIEPKMANKLWDELFSNFNAYLFCRAHAIAYSFISYHTAYLKAHFPLEFLTANLHSEVKSNAKKAAGNIAKIKSEIRQLKVKIIPPDINKSEMSYQIVDDNTLLTGLDALKFIGNNAIPEILAKRPFGSFEEFLSKVDGRKVTSKSVQALAASGCLDSFGMSRKAMYLYASDYKKKLQIWLKKNKGASFNYPWPQDIQEWTIPERYAMEIFYLGEGLSGNVVQAYPGFFDKKALNFALLPSFYPPPVEEESKKSKSNRFEQIPISSSIGIVEGVIKDYFEFRVKKEDSKIFGQTVGKITLEDTMGNNISVTVWPDKLKELAKRFKELGGSKVKLEAGTAIHIAGYISWYDGVISIIYDDLKKCIPQPAVPSDLASKKVSMRITGAKKLAAEIPDLDSFTEEFEDEVTEQGLAELDESEDEEDIWTEEISSKPDAFS